MCCMLSSLLHEVKMNDFKIWIGIKSNYRPISLMNINVKILLVKAEKNTLHVLVTMLNFRNTKQVHTKK